MFIIGENTPQKIFRTAVIIAAGEELAVDQPSELRGAITVNFPAASSVDAETLVDVVIPKTFSAGEKVINCQGSDGATDGDTTDTSYTIPDGFYGTIRFMSNGVDEWRY